VTTIEAVLFDRDGTLVEDVPYNGDPDQVRPVPGARAALDRLRAAGVKVGLVTNQSGVARGWLTPEQVAAVNDRVERTLGSFDAIVICPHGPGDGCACRKPAPGMVTEAAWRLGVRPEACAVIGDIGSDMEAAAAAGARGILVPTPVTRPEEVEAAPEVASSVAEAVDRLLQKRKPHVLVARLDSLGDVLLAGPAVRAVAAGASRVTLLCGPRGRAAAELLPGVDDVVCFRAPWIDPDPDPVSPEAVSRLVDELAGRRIDQAVVLTSFHQSALPLALLLRLAGVPTVAAISEDYPGSLLDVRHRVPDLIHEVERSLSLVASLGYEVPSGDDRRLAIQRAGTNPLTRHEPYVAVHPGASVPARAWSPQRYCELVGELAASGRQVVVTGGPDEASLTASVAGGAPGVIDAGGSLSFAELAEVLASADVVVTGNTGPAHLAAAVGTPVVSLFAPTVPAACWRPWAVPQVLLGVQDIGCAGCRARQCPVPGHPCIDTVTVAEVIQAVQRLSPAPAPAARGALV
jgi:HAD superfamily hydrolase (TIGR01662 family)